jgi:anti-anti-sigma factor
VSNVRKIIHVEPPAEIDLATLERFSEEIDRALRQAPDVLVVDCVGVQFMGAGGVEVLRSARDHLGERGGRLRLLHAEPHIQRVLDLDGDFD